MTIIGDGDFPEVAGGNDREHTALHIATSLELGDQCDEVWKIYEARYGKRHWKMVWAWHGIIQEARKHYRREWEKRNELVATDNQS